MTTRRALLLGGPDTGYRPLPHNNAPATLGRYTRTDLLVNESNDALLHPDDMDPDLAIHYLYTPPNLNRWTPK